MNDNDSQKVIRILEEIRGNQGLQIGRQREALTIQREQLAIFQKQAERAERLQEKAERLQEKSAQLVGGARKALAVVLAYHHRTYRLSLVAHFSLRRPGTC